MAPCAPRVCDPGQRGAPIASVDLNVDLNVDLHAPALVNLTAFTHKAKEEFLLGALKEAQKQNGPAERPSEPPLASLAP